MYKYLDHTADLYIEVKAKNIKKLFVDSTKSILEYTTILDKNNKDYKNRTFTYEGKIENILIEFLNDILFLSLVRKLYLKKINTFSLENFDEKKELEINKKYTLNIECTFNKSKKTKKEIKAITYYGTKLIKNSDYYIIKFIADI
jgi:SHS2 domain-containing protein